MASSMKPAMGLAGIIRRNLTKWQMLRTVLPSTRKANRCQPFSSISRSSSEAFRSKTAVGGITVGTTWAFLGLFKKKELSEEDQIREMVSEGIVKKGKGDIEGASKAFHDALKLSQEFLSEKKITEKDNMNHKVFIYDQIANMSMEMGQLTSAEQVFKETMKLALMLGMDKDDNAMIEMSLKLSMIFLYTGRTEIAHQGLQHCIAAQEKKLEVMAEEAKQPQPDKPVNPEEKKKAEELAQNTKILLGKAYKNYANSFLQSRDFKKAEPLIEKSLEISKAEMGHDNDMTFVIMNDLATCKIMLKEHTQAETLLTDGIKASKKAKSVMQAALSSNLGALYIRTGRYEEAETTCSQGLAIAEKFKDNYFLGPCKACLAKLQELKDLKKAAGEEEKKGGTNKDNV